MPKWITSPVKRFSGTVGLSDPLTFPQTFAFEDALNAAGEMRDSGSMARLRYALLPGIFACVEEWKLSGIPEHPGLDTFPASPRQSIAELIDWLIGEISALYREADDVPLA